MEVSRIVFSVEVDGRTRVAEFLRKEKIADLLTSDDETLGAWLRSLVTEAPDGSRDEWLKLYTWLQPDGSIDFTQPRRRPEGLHIDSRERWTEI